MLSHIFGIKGASGYSSSTTAEQVASDNAERIRNRVFIVTGASGGIGLETARVLALNGGHVILACRPGKKAEDAFQGLKKAMPNAKVELMQLRVDSLASVRQFVQEFEDRKLPLHVLINNAGIMACPKQISEDGYELQFATNHLGHFLLTSLLLPKLVESGPGARVVCLSSMAHHYAPQIGIDFENLRVEKSYSPWEAYGQSKLANLLHARWLNIVCQRGDLLMGGGAAKNVTAYAVHPGVIRTDLMKGTMESAAMLLGTPFMKSIPQGAATTVYCAVSSGAPLHSGGYFSDCNVDNTLSAQGQDLVLAERLYTASEEITRLTRIQVERAARKIKHSSCG